MAENIGGVGRPIRFCPLCQQADDHPKHLVINEDANIGRHMDCCAAAGCPDGNCDVVTAEADGATGKKMLSHVTQLHQNNDVPALLAEHRAVNPHQDPEHESFVGWPHLGFVAVNLQGADR